MIVEDHAWRLFGNNQDDEADEQTTCELNIAPLLPARTRARGQVLIDCRQTDARQGDERCRLKEERSKLAVEQRTLRPIHSKAADHDPCEQTGDQLTDVDHGENREIECTRTLPEGLQTEEHNGVEQATGQTSEKNRYTAVDDHLSIRGHERGDRRRHRYSVCVRGFYAYFHLVAN